MGHPAHDDDAPARRGGLLEGAGWQQNDRRVSALRVLHIADFIQAMQVFSNAASGASHRLASPRVLQVQVSLVLSPCLSVAPKEQQRCSCVTVWSVGVLTQQPHHALLCAQCELCR